MWVAQMPIKQLHLQAIYNAYQWPDSGNIYKVSHIKRVNPIPFHSGCFSQPYPEALSNRCLLWSALKLLCTKKGRKEEEIPDLN